MSKVTRHAWRLAAVLLVGLVLRLPAFASPLLSDDEAIYATTADAMRRGDALYRDVVDHKPPAIYDVYLAGFLALGPYNTQGAHLLVLASVPMGARFSFCNYMTGVSPGTETEWGGAGPAPTALPGSWNMLFADLDRRQPRLIVDVAAAGWDRYGPFRMERYPRLAAYVRAHYVEREQVDGVMLYERSGR